MDALIDREGFSARLRQGMRDAKVLSDSPTELAAQFNRRHLGASVTPHAARKWLMGEAIPTQAKLRTLAQWLAVSPDWLRFGEAANDARRVVVRAGAARPSRVDLALIADVHRLDERQRRIVRELVRTLLLLQPSATARRGTDAARLPGASMV